ncbi:VOC family protein [Streptomyces malaysiensis]|uniref:VOC family protein n=1 Tax=Streptomyces malaysiensis TaxID=92644 RepID=UPI000BFB321B|nr:VOC family protein [Streptomyces malaysiensis]ATL88269.1 glyoxalase/bleomycin resistance protein/dioxygenase [Streptomyces malaysiensis]QDL68430.1 glyoxalase [Streptomyces malaysiensis]
MTHPTHSAVNVSKVGYVGFETPDLDRLVDYYTNVLDFALVEKSADQAYLTTTFDHHSVVLERAETKRARSFVGYQIEEDLDSAERRLRDSGYEVRRRSDIAPSTPDVLIVAEPMSGTPLHLYDAQSGTGATGYTPLRPTKLGHVAAFTPDLKRQQSFYQDLLGFKWSDTVADFFVFLRCNTDHHAANFMASTKYSGMHHVAYETRDLDHLQSLLDHLASRDTRLEWGPGRHGPGHNVFTYHRDPDGNNIELFTQLDQMADEALGYFEPRPWHQDFPQRPKTWEADIAAINSWGGPIVPQQLDH